MNIFVLDSDPAACARAHCDKHVIKMILEHAQMACTVAHKLHLPDVPYRATHANHPCTLWLGESRNNLLWLEQLTIYLDFEKCVRFNSGSHKSLSVLMNVVGQIADMLPDIPRTPLRSSPSRRLQVVRPRRGVPRILP